MKIECIVTYIDHDLRDWYCSWMSGDQKSIQCNFTLNTGKATIDCQMLVQYDEHLAETLSKMRGSVVTISFDGQGSEAE